MDSNQDGLITISEYIAGDQQRIIATGLMNYIDLNKNKLIEESELLAVFDIVNINATKLNTALTNMNCSLPLNYKDFINFARQLPNVTLPCKANMICDPPADSYWTIFGQIDANKDGNVSVSELMTSTYAANVQNQSFNDLDLNGDGQIEEFEWDNLFKTESLRADFKDVNFTIYDMNHDSKWNKTEFTNYLIDHGLETRHAWYIMYKYHGPITSDIAYALIKTIPNPNFRIIVSKDSEVLNGNYVKGIPHYLRNVSFSPI
uniref:EF-hand domain-containing protein n=1 Tax=Panagrolaimus sp. JU765 TaxID=591449 RepID=A0AC34QWN0_9BILA